LLRWVSIGLPERRELPEISVERAIFLRHKYDVIDGFKARSRSGGSGGGGAAAGGDWTINKSLAAAEGQQHGRQHGRHTHGGNFAKLPG